MFKKLRIRFILTAMIAVFLVLGVIVVGMNIVNYANIDKKADETLQMLVRGGGKLPENTQPSAPGGAGGNTHDRGGTLSPEAKYTTRYFTVTLGTDGTLQAVDCGKISAVSEETAESYAKELWQDGKQSGYRDAYKYTVLSVENGVMYIFLDCHVDLGTYRNFLWTSIAVSAAGFLVVSVLVIVFSRFTVRSVAESYEKQKRFITDAGHELKTPLTIIDADVEVLEMEQGESEWTASIRHQTARLAALTEKLILLAKLHESEHPDVMTDFSLSDALAEECRTFEPVALSKGKTLRCDIAENITLNGEEKSIRRLIDLLVDNAMKYSDEKGTISVLLHKRGRGAVLTVENTTDGIQKGNLDLFFDRFYRAESSRNSSTGGHGIGLAVAKAIVEAHRGKIHAESKDGRIFSVTVTL